MHISLVLSKKIKQIKNKQNENTFLLATDYATSKTGRVLGL